MLGKLEQKIKSDPAASNWIKDQLNILVERDVVDALNDLEILTKILNERLTLSIEQARKLTQKKPNYLR